MTERIREFLRNRRNGGLDTEPCLVVDLSVLDLSDPRFFIPWRLSGLLSGYLPTDTRPQARAKLGRHGNKRFESASQQFF